MYVSRLLVFRVGDFTHPQVREVTEDERVADAMNKGVNNEIAVQVALAMWVMVFSDGWVGVDSVVNSIRQ